MYKVIATSVFLAFT